MVNRLLPLIVGYVLVILAFVIVLVLGSAVGWASRTLSTVAWFIGLLVVSGVVTAVVIATLVSRQDRLRKRVLRSVSTSAADVLVFAGAWAPSVSPPMIAGSMNEQNRFGAGLIVRVSASGIQIFRQDGSSLDELGVLRWSAIHEVTGEAKRVGRREIPILRFRVDPVGTQLMSVCTFSVNTSSLPPHTPPAGAAVVGLIEGYRPDVAR